MTTEQAPAAAKAAKKHWTPDDIPWAAFDAGKVDPDILRIIKAASLVEYNGNDYAEYLCGVFHDDPAFQEAARQWAVEEIQHGAVLGRWAQMADPDFDLEAARRRFTEGFRVNIDATESVRGSRSGELIARCMVETGTSSYYTALRAATDEPVLREICRNIAADELRHWKLFYTHLKRYLDTEQIGFWRRLAIAVGRARETEDDELSFAFYVANGDIKEPYDRKKSYRAYVRRAARFYQPETVERAVAMTFKAVGLKPHSRLNLMTSKVASWQARRIANKPDLYDSIAA
ncbi:MAG: ferritin-like domain-containing protein [Alphaproteobacteria bacterium]